jgi:diguanylate cyclase (GGDEF)-like protein
MRKYLMFKFFVLLFGVISTNIQALADEVIGQQQAFTSSDSPQINQVDLQQEWVISGAVYSLKVLSEHDKVAAQVKLLELQSTGLTLNIAEQYLLNVIRANISDIKGQEHKVINWLNKAILLEPSLAKKQLDSPLFADTYLLLSKVYQRQGEDKLAFDNKKKYIKKYFAHLKQQKELRVNRLNEKYNIEKKHEENELLTQNNEIKQYALTQAESERTQQQINIVIFIVAVSVFFLLLVRQFKIRRALKLLAKTDSLTQLPNRRAFFNSGDAYMHKALSSDKELSILMLDIDNFKMINDNLGHDAGDSVICNVAALAAETMRSRDLFARIGGEEFAAILPDATIEQARAIAEHIREKIQDSIQDHSNKNSKLNSSVTVSIGIASIRDVKENFDSLLHAADLAMYQAKINGRNQVFSFTNEKK